MKLRNKKTGKIVELEVHTIAGKCYESLADVNKDWDDYEEPIDFWTIKLETLEPYHLIDERKMRIYSDDLINNLELIGFKFATKEEAEKAINKLKAIKRLKDKGIRFGRRQYSSYGGDLFWDCHSGMGVKDKQIWKDIYLLFGGKE